MASFFDKCVAGAGRWLSLAAVIGCSEAAPTVGAQENSAASVSEKSVDDNPVAANRSTNSRPEELRRSWPTFRGDLQRTGRAYRTGPRTGHLKWIFRTGGRIYADTAIAPDGTLYVASHDHFIYAVSSDGRELWSYDTKGKIWSSPALAKDGTIYVGSDADRLVALFPTGSLRWLFSTAQEAALDNREKAARWDVDTSPAVLADGTIVFGAYTHLIALRPSGTPRWNFVAGAEKAKVFSSPAVGRDGTIFFGTQGSYFFALNESAKVLWYVKTDGDNDSTPVVGDDGTVYFASDDGFVRAVSPGGNIKWTFEVGHPIRAPLALGHDGTIYASTFAEQPFLIALDGVSGEEKWRFLTEPGEGAFFGIQSGALVDAESYVYFGARDHSVYCLDPDGKKVWSYRTGDQVDSSPVLGADGVLYIGSDDGRLYAFDS